MATQPGLQLLDLPGTALQQLLLSVPAPIAFTLATTCRRFREELQHNRKVCCVLSARDVMNLNCIQTPAFYSLRQFHLHAICTGHCAEDVAAPSTVP